MIRAIHLSSNCSNPQAQSTDITDTPKPAIMKVKRLVTAQGRLTHIWKKNLMNI